MSDAARVKLTARGAARVRLGHPWIYRADTTGDAKRRDPSDPAGSRGLADAASPAGAVVVLDERGRAIASALAAAPPAPIALRVYALGAQFVPFDERLLAERLTRALAGRRALYGPAADVYRLVHAEADLLPGLFVDRWGDAAVVQSGTAAVDALEPVIARLVRDLLGVRLVVARNDGSLRDHEALPRRKGILLGDGPTLVTVREGAASLELDLLDDAKTGGFLDQRENHARVAELARGECLDAFTYHGGFALAMAPRAAHVLAIDEDARAAERARANAKRSGFENVEVLTADAFATLRAFERAGRQFDVVVIDPPALAKRTGPLDHALRAYHELNLRAMRLTREDGLLITCSCSGKVTPPHFHDLLLAAARDARRSFAILERRAAGRDHPILLGVPETDYLKCWILGGRS